MKSVSKFIFGGLLLYEQKMIKVGQCGLRTASVLHKGKAFPIVHKVYCLVSEIGTEPGKATGSGSRYPVQLCEIQLKDKVVQCELLSSAHDRGGFLQVPDQTCLLIEEKDSHIINTFGVRFD